MPSAAHVPRRFEGVLDPEEGPDSCVYDLNHNESANGVGDSAAGVSIRWAGSGRRVNIAGSGLKRAVFALAVGRITFTRSGVHRVDDRFSTGS